MNLLTEFINCVEEINIDDTVYIAEEKIAENIIIKKVLSMLNKDDKDKIYIFINELIKFENRKIISNLKKVTDNISDIFFKYIKRVQKKNIKRFSAIFLNYYFFNKLSNEELKLMFTLTANLDNDYFDFIWGTKRNNSLCFNERYGKVLEKNGFADKIFKIGDIEYQLNDNGKKYFENVYLDITKKEKKYYSKIINLKELNKFKLAKDHKEYYNMIIEKIPDNEVYIKMIRLHEGLFKEFIEEYDVLIKYAIAKYGEECNIRFCGNETNEQIKCDGIIIHDEVEEKIEITYPFFDEETNEEMKQLNNFGHTFVKTYDPNNYKKEIFGKINKKIEEKNNSDSYDDSVHLVVMMDMFDFLFDEEIRNQKFYDSLFDSFKEQGYRFKSVEILIDKYSKDSKPWIYIIK